MAAAVLNHINDWFAANIFAPLQSSGAPAARIRAMSKSVDKFYNHGQQACLLAVLLLGMPKTCFTPRLSKPSTSGSML